MDGKIIVDIDDLEIVDYITKLKVDGIRFGEKDYCFTSNKKYADEFLDEIVLKLQSNGFIVQVKIDKVFTDFTIDDENMVKRWLDRGVDIVFGDFAVYELTKQYNKANKLIYQPYTLITNSKALEVIGGMGIEQVAISPHLSVDEIKMLGVNSEVSKEIQVHGLLPIFYSRRYLVDNYKTFLGEDGIVNEGFLIEELRKESLYPIKQTEQGTVVYTDFIFDIVDKLDVLLKSNIDTFVLNFKDCDDTLIGEVVSQYNIVLDAVCESPELKSDLVQEAKAVISDLYRTLNPKLPISDGIGGEQDGK